MYITYIHLTHTCKHTLSLPNFGTTHTPASSHKCSTTWATNLEAWRFGSGGKEAMAKCMTSSCQLHSWQELGTLFLEPQEHGYDHPSYRRGELALARFSYARARRTKLRFAGLSSMELSLSMSVDCPLESRCSSRSWFWASVRWERGWLDPAFRSWKIQNSKLKISLINSIKNCK